MTYDVHVSREGDLWVADIPALIAAVDTLRREDLDMEVRGMIAGLTDADPDAVQITWHVTSDLEM